MVAKIDKTPDDCEIDFVIDLTPHFKKVEGIRRYMNANHDVIFFIRGRDHYNNKISRHLKLILPKPK